MKKPRKHKFNHEINHSYSRKKNNFINARTKWSLIGSEKEDLPSKDESISVYNQ